MKYSDILFEKTCVNLYLQIHCTVCKMLQGDRRRERPREVTEGIMGSKQNCKKGRHGGHKDR